MDGLAAYQCPGQTRKLVQRSCWTGRRRGGPSAAPTSPNSTPSFTHFTAWPLLRAACPAGKSALQTRRHGSRSDLPTGQTLPPPQRSRPDAPIHLIPGDEAASKHRPSRMYRLISCAVRHSGCWVWFQVALPLVCSFGCRFAIVFSQIERTRGHAGRKSAAAQQSTGKSLR